MDNLESVLAAIATAVIALPLYSLLVGSDGDGWHLRRSLKNELIGLLVVWLGWWLFSRYYRNAESVFRSLLDKPHADSKVAPTSKSEVAGNRPDGGL